jgi:hypothetical protein
MLAGRLIRAAKDILGEYARFNIGERLPAALNLATRRAQMSDQEYINQAHQLRQWAQSVIDQTKIEKYPFDLLTFLKESQYSSALPERIATIVLRSFPDDKNAAILSPELNLYIQQVNNLRSELGALVTAGQKLNIDEVEIPPDAISLDVIMPRNVFHDKADKFVDTLSKFIRIMSYLIELTTGSKESPTVTYTSASVIVTGLALGYGAVCGFLTFYNLLLDVVQKQLSILKTIKDYRAALLDSEEHGDLEVRLKAIVEKALTDAVEKVVASVKPEVPENRVNEIKIALGKDARFAVEAIANGTRIGITIESLDQIPKISEAVPGVTAEQIDAVVKQQKVLERRVDEAFAALEGKSPALLTVSSVEDKGE